MDSRDHAIPTVYVLIEEAIYLTILIGRSLTSSLWTQMLSNGDLRRSREIDTCRSFLNRQMLTEHF